MIENFCQKIKKNFVNVINLSYIIEFFLKVFYIELLLRINHFFLLYLFNVFIELCDYTTLQL